MAKLSYTSSEALGQFQFTKRECDLLIEALTRTGPHDKYSSNHTLLKTIVTGRRKIIEDTLAQAKYDQEYTSDAIIYPETKEAS